MRTYKDLFIGGERVAPSGTQTLTVRSPYDGEPMGMVPLADVEDIDRAVRVARSAFDLGPWPRMTPADRMAVLCRFTDLHAARADEYAQFIVRENGSPLWYARAVQSNIAAQSCAFLDVARRYPWETRTQAFPVGSTSVRREAIGVVAAVVSWDAPHQSALSRLFPALLTGNVVILKLAKETAVDGQFLGELFAEAGLPLGVLSIVAAHRDASEHLLTHPDVDKVSFTGSTETGRRIASLAGGQLKSVSLELSGGSAAIVLEDAKIEAFTMGLIYDAFSNSGQSSIATARVLVPRQRHDDIVEALVAKASTLTVGDPTDVGTFFGPQVSAAQQARVTGRIASGIEQGARLVMGGLGMPKGLKTGHFVRPTIFARVDNRMEIARRAIFGPVMVVIPYDDVDDAVQIANDSDYGLFGAVWTDDAAVGLDIARRVRTGTVKVNAARQDFLAPFGGIKQSGLGRTFGASGMDGGFNWSMQHTENCVSRRSVADEVPDTKLLHRQPEGLDVGALERRLDASTDRPAI